MGFLEQSFQQDSSNLIILNKFVSLLFIFKDIDRLKQLLYSKLEFQAKNLNLQMISQYLKHNQKTLINFKSNKKERKIKMNILFKKIKDAIINKQDIISIYFYGRKTTKQDLKIYQNFMNDIIYKKSIIMLINLLKDDFLYN